MSNPFKEEARKTNRAKLSKEGVSGKDSEDSYARAQRIAKGYADGGAVPTPKPDPRYEQTYPDGKKVFSK